MMKKMGEEMREDLGDDVDAAEALHATFGAVPDAASPSRDEWRRG